MTRGLGIAKGFDKSRTHGWFISVTQPDGRRPKQYFPDQKARDKAYNAKVLEVRTVGVGAAQPISTADRTALAEMSRLAEPTGLPILEIFNRGLAQLGGAVAVNKLTVMEAAASFMTEQDARHRDGKLSAVRLKEVRNILTRYVAVSGKRRLTDCTRVTLKTYLASLKVGPQTRVNNARVLSFFFGWCVAEGMVFKNPVPEQEGVSRIPVVFTNDQSNALFECAWDHHPSLLPMLAVQWLAGLRPGASHHLRWEDIDFERARILIQPHGNKLRQPDIVRDLPLSVFGLLAHLREASGLLVPADHVEQNKALHHRLGYGKGGARWPEDVARHTFASNLYALYEQDTKRVETVMLHSTSVMLRKHYLLKNIPLESARAYFGRYLPSA